MSYYDNHAEACDGTECVTYECQLLNRDESPEVAAVIALWESLQGWIPGGARAELAAALGVPVERLRTAQQIQAKSARSVWEDSVRAGNRCKDPMCACSTIPTDNGGN